MQRYKETFLILLAISVVGFGSSLLYANAQPEESTQPVAQVVQLPPPSADEILRLVNEERAKVNVAPLIVFEPAVRSAQFKADDMVKNNYFSHKGHDTDENNGLRYLDSIDEGVCSRVGENLGWGKYENTSKALMTAWIDSEPHYKAMINPELTHTGIGIADTKIVQHFCKLR